MKLEMQKEKVLFLFLELEKTRDIDQREIKRNLNI